MSRSILVYQSFQSLWCLEDARQNHTHTHTAPLHIQFSCWLAAAVCLCLLRSHCKAYLQQNYKKHTTRGQAGYNNQLSS